MGRGGKKNGELLRLAEKRFDAFLTADQKLPSQQNLTALRMAVVTFAARSNRLQDLELLVPKLLEALNRSNRV